METGGDRVTPAAKVSWSDLCPACKGYPDQGHRYDATCKEERPAACRHTTTAVKGDKVTCLSCGHSWRDFLIWSSRGR